MKAGDENYEFHFQSNLYVEEFEYSLLSVSISNLKGFIKTFRKKRHVSSKREKTLVTGIFQGSIYAISAILPTRSSAGENIASPLAQCDRLVLVPEVGFLQMFRRAVVRELLFSELVGSKLSAFALGIAYRAKIPEDIST